MNQENDLKVPPDFILFLFFKKHQMVGEQIARWLKFQFFVEDCVNKLEV